MITIFKLGLIHLGFPHLLGIEQQFKRSNKTTGANGPKTINLTWSLISTMNFYVNELLMLGLKTLSYVENLQSIIMLHLHLNM